MKASQKPKMEEDQKAASESCRFRTAKSARKWMLKSCHGWGFLFNSKAGGPHLFCTAQIRCNPIFRIACALLLAVGTAMPVRAAVPEPWLWRSEEMVPLQQYRAYCRAYGHRDLGCHPDLGGTAPLDGPDRIEGRAAELGKALLIHRQVVAALVRRPDRQDVGAIAGAGGQGMAGDCDDVVMTAISRLVHRGFPRGALRATLVELPDDGGYHLILGLHTQAGDFFLDDRSRWLLSLADALARGYRFVAQEQPGETLWRRLATFPARQIAEQEGVVAPPPAN